LVLEVLALLVVMVQVAPQAVAPMLAMAAPEDLVQHILTYQAPVLVPIVLQQDLALVALVAAAAEDPLTPAAAALAAAGEEADWPKLELVLKVALRTVEPVALVAMLVNTSLSPPILSFFVSHDINLFFDLSFHYYQKIDCIMNALPQCLYVRYDDQLQFLQR
jgi:hypothetical protein